MATNNAIVMTLCAVLLSGCGQAWTDTFELDRGFERGTQGRAAWEDAAGEWCDRAGLCAREAERARSKIRRVHDADLAVEGAESQTTPYSDGASLIEIADSVEIYDLRVIILHELGHHFGCANSTDPSTIMAGSRERTAEHLTDADIECTD